MKEVEIKRGQPITFRVPSDTPDHILKHLGHLKKTEKRNFSSKIAEFVLNGVSDSKSKQRETLTIVLPKGLSKTQRDWIKHEHSEALLGSIVYQLLADPVRAASLLATLNSRALDIDEALYLQEETVNHEPIPETVKLEEQQIEERLDDDLDSFNWETATKADSDLAEEDKVEDLDDLLGDFLAQMNK
ncbi:hypothetical protein BEP19_11760 [Ammoniphilus oxalaticus]|uniref:Uncharacterized protein n=1 Tax=Ammoniphilus oxalaticus TaxID=66863 RepID=A0A419SGP3_9BACL|nr:hypothetical protein [Ammoniphilus oxalaticus]RKD22905.1 hypothetical protein BEP19_11760 [Ammoniphilus oxalaticus]